MESAQGIVANPSIENTLELLCNNTTESAVSAIPRGLPGILCDNSNIDKHLLKCCTASVQFRHILSKDSTSGFIVHSDNKRVGSTQLVHLSGHFNSDKLVKQPNLTELYDELYKRATIHRVLYAASAWSIHTNPVGSTVCGPIPPKNALLAYYNYQHRPPWDRTECRGKQGRTTELHQVLPWLRHTDSPCTLASSVLNSVFTDTSHARL